MNFVGEFHRVFDEAIDAFFFVQDLDLLVDFAEFGFQQRFFVRVSGRFDVAFNQLLAILQRADIAAQFAGADGTFKRFFDGIIQVFVGRVGKAFVIGSHGGLLREFSAKKCFNSIFASI